MKSLLPFGRAGFYGLRGALKIALAGLLEVPLFFLELAHKAERLLDHGRALAVAALFLVDKLKEVCRERN